MKLYDKTFIDTIDSLLLVSMSFVSSMFTYSSSLLKLLLVLSCCQASAVNDYI